MNQPDHEQAKGMMTSCKRIINILTVVVCFEARVLDGDWTQFRGPDNSGVSPDSQAPSQWSDTTNLAWSQKIPGYGWSSPIVVGDKIFVTTAVSDKQKRPQPFSFGMIGKVKPPDTVYR